jgi:uncharacterized YceG family protein
MDERPNLNVVTSDPTPTEERRRERRRRRRGSSAAAAVGILAGAAAIAVAVILVRGGGGNAAGPATTPPATTTALPTLKIVFPEGFTIEQMADRIRDVNGIAKDKRHTETSLVPKTYLAQTRRSKLPGQFAADGKSRSLEGFLFPATYSFTPVTTARQLIDMQLDAFRGAWSQVDLAYAKKKKLTPYDVLIIASMIEREVRVPKERALVAAVIYNRLKAGMALGIDATLRYGLHIPPTQAITQSELDSGNPYNTSKRPGLPPTPIANPGLASMQAAAHPAHVEYLYFARKKDCRSHFFTRSAQAFDAFLNGPNSFRSGPNECS